MLAVIKISFIVFIGVLLIACSNPSSSKKAAETDATLFPSELVNFIPYKNNPVFTGGGAGRGIK
jgi:hypothetical protein